MRIHEREMPTNRAANALTIAMLEELQNHDLTDGEYIRVVANATNSILSGWAKETIRFERHGNYDTPGGFAREEEQE